MRGELEAGPNRMNIYTARKVTEGLARYIEKQGTVAKRRGVAISYDSRHQSQELALEAAKTLGIYGIQTYVFEEMCPTPELAFVVRYLHAYAATMIGASHNPAANNGYKVYGQDGAQLPLAAAAYYKSIKSSFYERLMVLFETYGYYEEALSSITIKGQKDIEQINNILTDLRDNVHLEFGTVPITKREDYQSRERIYKVEETYETIDLPKSSVMKCYLKDGSWVAVRPSGTEAKIKFYFAVIDSGMTESKRRIKGL